jgi:L-serine dehydratase
LIEIRSRKALPGPVGALLASRKGVAWMRTLSAVLPVLSRRDMQVPFITSAQMLDWNRDRHLDLSGLAAAYESARGGISESEVEDRMQALVAILRSSIARGIAGTRFADRILGVQSAGFKDALEKGALLDAGMLNAMILYVTALMEVKSAMGVIVAAPTAGSCGGLPGAVIAAADAMGRSETDMTRAMLAAGMIGVFISAHSTFAAEVCGCLAECGAGSGMAAAALVTLAGGSARQAVDAAAMAIQNVLGMICDPVANRVEVPCLGRNVLAAGNALACANMALAGYDPVIPLDEVIDTMDRVGKSLPMELRCTTLGGLSITPTSKAVAKMLSAHSP